MKKKIPSLYRCTDYHGEHTNTHVRTHMHKCTHTYTCMLTQHTCMHTCSRHTFCPPCAVGEGSTTAHIASERIQGPASSIHLELHRIKAPSCNLRLHEATGTGAPCSAPDITSGIHKSTGLDFMGLLTTDLKTLCFGNLSPPNCSTSCNTIIARPLFISRGMSARLTPRALFPSWTFLSSFLHSHQPLPPRFSGPPGPCV